MPNLVQHIARKIKDLRESKGLTQTALSRELGVTANTISRWESGTYKPKLEDLEKLARFFEEPIWVLFPVDAQPPTEAHRALLSATADLPAEDIAELERYADFVRARKKLRAARTPRSTNKGDKRLP